MKEYVQVETNFSNWLRKNQQEVLELKQLPIEYQQHLPVLTYPLLDQTGIVKHCFTTRLGGVSEGIFSSLNLSFSRGDKRAAVEENYRRLASALSVDYGSFVCSDQTHTINVIRIGVEDAGNGILKERPYTDVDGMITNDPGVTLVTYYADCVPLYFVDPVQKSIGLSHSGWKGTAGGMGRVTIEAMTREFGSHAQDIICAIGPSICQDCYEVGEDVAKEFQKSFRGQEDMVLMDKGNGKYLLDLWKANEIILLEAGIQKEHLAVTNLCTCCNKDLLFSHRGSHGKRGNLAAVLALKENNE